MHGLNLSSIRGQCYDGSASMKWCYSGVQNRTKIETPLALYTHCYAHILNLCLVDLATFIPLVRIPFGTLSTVHNCIRTCLKRYAVFKKVQKESDNLSIKKVIEWYSLELKLHWKSIPENVSTVIETFLEINQTNVHSSSEASLLLHCIQNFEFIFWLQVLKAFLDLTIHWICTCNHQ